VAIFSSVANSARLEVLLPLLQCPACCGEFAAARQSVECRSCRSRYPVIRGVPRLVANPAVEGDRPGPLVRAVHNLAARPSVYDCLQDLAGAKEVRERVAHRLADANARTVLDIGAGTGTLADQLPPDTTYVWLDNDPAKLDGFFARRDDIVGVVADGTRIPFRDAAVDYAVCVNVSHHLRDAELRRLIAEVGRVAREGLVFVDAVATPRLRSRLLWRYDRGARPRTIERLLGAMRSVFEVVEVESFRIHHDYALISGRPRKGATALL
jgi:SAM-dependent methyltransferase/uncharacterized protein YbaR (Trm112 family)